MASPRLDDANIEYVFSEMESRAARILDPLKIIWLQTKYAQIWKRKAASLMPESVELDRSYIQQICELEGQLNFIQELLDDHKKALAEMSTASVVAAQTESGIQVDKDVQKIEVAAGSRVHTN